MIKSALRKVAYKTYISGRDQCDAAGMYFLRTGPPGDVIIDIGCSDGGLTQQFMRAARASKTVGLDFVDTELQHATGRGIEARKADLSFRWPVDDGECDILVSSQNIEHMHRTVFYCQEMFRVLRPGGRAVVLTENLSSWANIAALIFGWEPFSTSFMENTSVGCPIAYFAHQSPDLQGAEQAAADGVMGVLGHVRVLSYCGLKDILQKVGFKVTRYKTTGYIPLWGSRPKQLVF